MKPQVPIEVDDTTGVWRTDGLPMLYVPRHFFMNNHRVVEQALGPERYSGIVYDAGYTSARTWCENEAKAHGLAGIRVFERYLLRLSQRGWGRFSFVSADAEAGEAQIRVDHSAFVLAGPKAPGKVCYMLGLVRGSDGLGDGCRRQQPPAPVKSNTVRPRATRTASSQCALQHKSKSKRKAMNYPHVFSPITLNQLVLPNRIYTRLMRKFMRRPADSPGRTATSAITRRRPRAGSWYIGHLRRLEPGLDRHPAGCVAAGQPHHRSRDRAARASRRGLPSPRHEDHDPGTHMGRRSANYRERSLAAPRVAVGCTRARAPRQLQGHGDRGYPPHRGATSPWPWRGADVR